LSVLDRLEEGQGWAGARGDDHTPSPEEAQELFTSVTRGSFLYYGPGKLGSVLPPSSLAGLDGRGIKLALLFDRAFTEAAARRLGAFENNLTPSMASMLGPHETVALLTLCGVSTVVTPVWPTTLHAHQRLLTHLYGPGKAEGRPVPRVVRAALAPPDLPSSEQAPASDGAEGVAEAPRRLKARVELGTVVYGWPHVTLV
jgi:hypothetical protein